MNEVSRAGTNAPSMEAEASYVLGRALRPTHAPFLIAAAFALLHAALVVLVDLSDAQLFVRADRAVERLDAVLGLLATRSSTEIEQYLATHGVVGDYAAHALLYSIAGRFGIVTVQIALALFSGLCVYRIGVLLGLTARASAIAMAVYLCLPHTIVFPHQLATEGLHIPLIAISTWLLVESFFRPKVSILVTSALCLGVATLIRPIMLLWPFVAAIALVISARPRSAVVYLMIALLPVLAWMSFVGTQSGEFGLGESAHSMERNLYQRVTRITATMPPATRDEARAAHLDGTERELGALGYLRFSIDYPVASLQHLLRDAMTFFGKSGVERITIDYLALRSGAKSVQDPKEGWRRQLEDHGPIQTARYLWETLGSVFLISLLGAVLMAGLVALGAIGMLRFLRQWRDLRAPHVLTGFLLGSLVVYTFVFSQVLNAMQSRHRAPAEFAIVLLAAAGLSELRKGRNRARSVGSREVSVVPRSRLNRRKRFASLLQ